MRLSTIPMLVFCVWISGSSAAPVVPAPTGQISYYVKFEDAKSLIRYGNRFKQSSYGSVIRNVHISNKDLRSAVKLINQRDRLRGKLNEAFQPGVSATGLKLKKRPQSLMHDLDPNTPINEEVDRDDANTGTKGYHTIGVVDLDGLMPGDTVILSYNRGTGSERLEDVRVMHAGQIGPTGNITLKVPLGTDGTTSTHLGVLVKFGKQKRVSRFENGSSSYKVNIIRSIQLPQGISDKPISRRRARNR